MKQVSSLSMYIIKLLSFFKPHLKLDYLKLNKINFDRINFELLNINGMYVKNNFNYRFYIKSCYNRN